jgi:hypothetical protein
MQILYVTLLAFGQVGIRVKVKASGTDFAVNSDVEKWRGALVDLK